MKKVIISGMIGNGLEWYDYALYAQYFYIISNNFFPDNHLNSIFTFAVFAIGSAARPFGGALLGYIGDLFGRKISLVIGILMMSIPTAIIGILPSYKSIGLLSPIILVIIRLLQGLALGGEFSGCISYVVESSTHSKRGLAGSTSFISMCLGILLGVGVTGLLSKILSENDLLSWGWRLPFIAGLFIGFIGIYIRKNLSETPIYKIAKSKGYLSRSPIRDTILYHKASMLIATLIYINVCVPFYALTVLMKDYMLNLGYSASQIDTVYTITLISMIIGIPISAHISDKIGRKPVLVFSSICLIIIIYPLFSVLNSSSKDYSLLIVLEILFALITGCYMGPIPTALVELFPTKIRFTGVALSYNTSVAIFGSTLPMIASIFRQYLGNYTNLTAYYMLLLIVFCFVFLLFYYKESYKKDISLDISYETGDSIHNIQVS
ncbi:MFS transporter [Rickettsia endosymbiont of Cardiosporidium cionae]|uniref:MFS transporter n=1 Tax=Rickettsia endosymbiont of Cardiosporidium cionae TaxID=2777155 RepID=UPI0018943BF5|nr:MFS transporter [Rickettsia endosymbiont of Cardiosporidium cionae]KAF8818846.1 MFS transporter [Rickettsia endosymbiont of Cardiosporidium cionae]